ncbi:MAG: exodeoxyribonuclease V subunit gamma [Myxococcota bacterium]
MLYVERSNRTERLLDGLAQRLRRPGRDPLATAFVVVQGPGMERWVAQSIARDHGVCANTKFPFPQQFLQRVFSALPEAEAANPAWEVGRLTWWIARILDERRDEAAFAPLARHLDTRDGDWRLVQLARQLANLMDRYITFRPEWAFAWDELVGAEFSPSGPSRGQLSLLGEAAGRESWQALLYAALREKLGYGHAADRTRAFLEGVSGQGASAGTREEWAESLARLFPGALEIFAVSTLPPLYLSAIAGLGELRDVHLSVMSPSRTYWADLWAEVRDASALEDAAPAADETDAPIQGGLFDQVTASPVAGLLAGLGRLGSDFQRGLEEHPQLQEGDADLFADPLEEGPASLLTRLQAQLLDLEEDPTAPAAGEAISPDDDSIRVHLCHGPRRELEVVEGLLRDAFDQDPTLRPEDVIVMAPVIDAIAPDIEAVFGAAEDPSMALPYRIADRGTFRRSPVAEAFRVLLELIAGRGTRSEVLDWLALPPVRERFELDEQSVEQVAVWAAEAGIRFGFDETHRDQMGLAAERGHTWRGGIDRLVLAHAVGASDAVFEGLRPEPLSVLASPSVLGALGDMEMLLRGARDAISKPRNVAAWCDWLRSLLERSLLQNDENAHEHATIREILIELSKSSGEAGFSKAVPFEAVRERVSDALQAAPTPQAFLAGGITFCELVPLRAIPFRVIAILGMSDTSFPRGTPAAGFDLMARKPRAGDRSTRNDDRYLFLEAILSARDKLILTAPARDLRDGSDLPPSVVVTELLDALDVAYSGEASSGDLRAQLVVPHPLQAHSPRYFEADGDARLRGRRAAAFDGASARRAALVADGGEVRRFLSESGVGRSGEAEAESGLPTLTLDEMIARVLKSTRTFARDRLSLRLPNPADSVDDLDPIEVDGLRRYSLGTALLSDLCEGAGGGEAMRRLRAHPALPVGVRGEIFARNLRGEAQEIARRVRLSQSGERIPDLPFELALEGVPGIGAARLTGVLDSLWPEGRVQYAFSKIGKWRDLDLWIRHLALCACVKEGADLAPRSIGFGLPETKKANDPGRIALGHVDEPAALLGQLFDWAWSVDESPLPFFPRASKAFATKALDGKEEQAWRSAQEEFHGNVDQQSRRGEVDGDLEMERVWEGFSPVDHEMSGPSRFTFDALAMAIFRPMRDAQKAADS